jgi:hypothetical protein
VPERGQAPEGIGDVTATGQQGADESTSGGSDDSLGSSQVDTDLAQPCEQTDLPTDTDGHRRPRAQERVSASYFAQKSLAVPFTVRSIVLVECRCWPSRLIGKVHNF